LAQLYCEARTFFERQAWFRRPASARKLWRSLRPKTEKFSHTFFPPAGGLRARPFLLNLNGKFFQFWSSENSERRKRGKEYFIFSDFHIFSRPWPFTPTPILRRILITAGLKGEAAYRLWFYSTQGFFKIGVGAVPPIRGRRQRNSHFFEVCIIIRIRFTL